jgi:hypothetical protein
MTNSSIFNHYKRANYHKFMISKEVMQLSYHSKIFLLNVFKSYDEALHLMKVSNNYPFIKPNFKKKYAWSNFLELNCN